MHGVDQVN